MNKFIPVTESGCWLWFGGCDRGGYGRYSLNGTMVSAHRFSYQTLIDAIPRHLEIDHLCRVRCCVNPAHMEPVTTRENILRGQLPQAVTARTGICSKGHVLSCGGPCKQCISLNKKRYREEHLHRIKHYMKDYYWRNKELLNVKNQEYRLLHRETLTARRRAVRALARLTTEGP